MHPRIKFVAYLHVVLGGLGLLLALAGLAAALLAGPMREDPDDVVAQRFLGGLLFISGGAVSLPPLMGGLGLLNGKESSRVLLIAVGAFSLFGVPLGTLVGGYTLWVLLIKWDEYRSFKAKPATPTELE